MDSVVLVPVDTRPPVIASPGVAPQKPAVIRGPGHDPSWSAARGSDGREIMMVLHSRRPAEGGAVLCVAGGDIADRRAGSISSRRWRIRTRCRSAPVEVWESPTLISTRRRACAHDFFVSVSSAFFCRDVQVTRRIRFGEDADEARDGRPDSTMDSAGPA